MPIHHAIWKIGDKPKPLPGVSLENEKQLEEMIIQDPNILSDRWLLIGQQVRTPYGGIVDLLALNPEGHVIIIELKRDQTPREVVAQAIDYASWVKDLEADKIVGIYDRFSGGGSLEEAFKQRFDQELDEEQLNGSHQIVIVASSLDFSTERIVNYLNGVEVPINVIFFQVFQDGDNRYLSRSWLIDPIETESKASTGSLNSNGEWNGEFYVSFGDSDDRDWGEAVQYGFISGGGGLWYSRTLFLLSPGDRVWVNVPKKGYVGVGRVTGQAVRAREFEVDIDSEKQQFMNVTKANHHQDFIDDEEKSEYFVPVEWIETKPLEEAISELGFFGNQNTVCRPLTSKWNHTVERLKRQFSINDN
jgi:hypothetical protein